VTRWVVRDDNPFGPGTIGVCLANAAGPATQDEVDAVARIVVPLKPLGSQECRVFAAAPQSLAVRATLYTDGTNPNAEADAQAAVAELAATYPIGSLSTLFVYRSKLIEILMEISGMRNVVVTAPAADVGLAPYAVFVLSPAPVFTVAS